MKIDAKSSKNSSKLFQENVERIICHKQMGFILEIPGWFNIWKPIHANHHTKSTKEKPYDHINWCRKTFNKIQHLITFFLNPSKLGIQGNFLNLIKYIYKNLTVNIILNGRRLNSFPLRLGRRHTLANPVQHHTGNHS